MRVPGRIADGLITGATMALVLLLAIYGIVLLSGNQQQRALNDIKSAARAQVCVLLLPVNEHGRDEGQTNSRCLVPNGIPPVDANDNGRIEYEGQ